MKPISKPGKYPGAGNSVLRVLLAACCWGLAVNANAVVDDEPYYQLFPGAPISGGVGSEDSVSICGTSGCTADEYMQVSVVTGGPTGTGYVNSFLRLNEPANAGQSTDGTPITTETGYNTNFGTLQETAIFDNDSQDSPSAGNPWNRAILLSDLLISDDGYYEIFLDLNEQGNGTEGKYIKLDEFEIHLSSSGELHEYDPNAGAPGAEQGYFTDSDGYIDKVFDMDYWNAEAPEAKTPGYGGLILDNCVGDKGCGSGDKDYLFRIPVSLFETDSDNPVYVHLVAALGEGDYDQGVWTDTNPDAFADAGFDEFWANECVERNRKGKKTGNVVDCGGGVPDTQIPVPGTALLLSLGLLGIYGRRRTQA